jgi:hypothetical protein
MPYTPYTAGSLKELQQQLRERAKERFDATYFEQWVRVTECADALTQFVEKYEGENQRSTRA